MLTPLKVNKGYGSIQQEICNSSSKSINTTTITSYARFYILFVFGSLCLLQNAIVNTWGPIARSAKVAYQWNDETSMIAWFGNIATISYIIATFLFLVYTPKFGLRSSVILAIFFVTLGVLLRLLPLTAPTSTVVLFIAHFFSSLAGPVCMSATTQISSNWFPVRERNMATGVSGQSSNMGVSLSFIIGPLLVPDVNTSNISSSTVSSVTNGIKLLLYIEAIACVIVLFLIIFYFPGRPKHFPSVSSSVTRIQLVQSSKFLMTNIPLLVLSLCYAIPVGINTGWYGYLYPNLNTLNPIVFTEYFTGWLGFYMSTAGAVSAVILSIIADYLPKKKKHILLILYSGGTICLTVFSLMCLNLISVSPGIVTAISVTAGAAISGIDPLMKELLVEIGFPIPEFTTCLFSSLLCNVSTMLFFIVLSFSSHSITWINWFQVVCYGVAVPVILFTPVRYPRIEHDLKFK